MAEKSLKYLVPKVFNEVANLQIKARRIMEGTVSGLHRSPYHGFSVEFAQHREYMPGDDLKHLDWKVFGRMDRLFIKQYEQETNLESLLAVDTSASMLYGSQGRTKFEYACLLAAGVAYLLMHQQDAIGVTFFDQHIKAFLQASTNPLQFRNVLLHLETMVAEQKTDLSSVFRELIQRIRRRSLVFIFSDFFADFESLKKGLQWLTSKRHEGILFHVLDPSELDFSFKRLTQFEALEVEGWKIRTDPKPLRKAYLEIIQNFLQDVKALCLGMGIDHVVCSTQVPVEITLSRYFVSRLGERKILKR